MAQKYGKLLTFGNLLLLLLFQFCQFDSASAGMVAKKLFTEDGYGVNVYECDKKFERLSTENRQKKVQGSSYRVCFRPNEKALEDGVSIKSIDYFNWEMEHKDGVAEQAAIINGQDDGILSILHCEEDGSLCYLESILGSPFYVDAGSVLGYGAATLTMDKGKVEMERFLFPHDFKFTMRHSDGSEMSEEEVQALLQAMENQEANGSAEL